MQVKKHERNVFTNCSFESKFFVISNWFSFRATHYGETLHQANEYDNLIGQLGWYAMSSPVTPVSLIHACPAVSHCRTRIPGADPGYWERGGRSIEMVQCPIDRRRRGFLGGSGGMPPQKIFYSTKIIKIIFYSTKGGAAALSAHP